MKGSADVIKVLNEVLRKELTGINQYFIHSKMCKNWGYDRARADMHWNESIDEMKHADQLVERILFLEGVPNITAYDKISGRIDRQAAVGERSRIGAGGVDGSQARNKNLPRCSRRRHPGVARTYRRRRRAPYRLDRNSVSSDQGSRLRELPGAADFQEGLSIYISLFEHEQAHLIAAVNAR